MKIWSMRITYWVHKATTTMEPETTQQSGQTLDKEVEIKNITVYVRVYTETGTTGMLSAPVSV